MTTSGGDPRDFGFYMPGEWAEHSCCWMAWPCRKGMWGDSQATQQAYADVANTIAKFEPLKMLVPPHKLESARSLLDAGIEIIELPIDDSWARDSGPNFLVSDSGELAGSTWVFNAWGNKYQPFDQDALMGTRILERAGVREFTSTLVAEGGGVTVDGEGTVITTETCFLNKNRNPGWTRKQVEAELCRTLGATKVIWLPGDPQDHETDGHVDGIAAFVEPGRVLLEINPDKTDPHCSIGEINLAALKNQKDAKGRTLQIEFIHEGIYHEGIWNGGCSSYVNSYLANGAVVVPGYGYDRDDAAVETYRNLYPERMVVQVQINDIAVGGGGVHCITQQQPAALR
ncbi:MAG: agmatine deiminase family protein [Gammaproteobacteria bacterium]|nr:agmatine deiminase family protein [Gammaproteobacteria bacterium]MDH4314717.1 agmatine deiminase family protein [Gammaproteobacteria bacterium]MDH5214551.1 agmatine deiminase family protein [Gammaproteobacteria bacterium]